MHANQLGGATGSSQRWSRGHGIEKRTTQTCCQPGTWYFACKQWGINVHRPFCLSYRAEQNRWGTYVFQVYVRRLYEARAIFPKEEEGVYSDDEWKQHVERDPRRCAKSQIFVAGIGTLAAASVHQCLHFSRNVRKRRRKKKNLASCLGRHHSRELVVFSGKLCDGNGPGLGGGRFGPLADTRRPFQKAARFGFVKGWAWAAGGVVAAGVGFMPEWENVPKNVPR